MTADLLFLLSLCLSPAVGAAVSGDLLEVTSAVGEDCVLQCTAEPKPGVQYRAVRWYKVGEPGLSGLLTRDLPNGTTRWYVGVDREVDLLGESRDILLPSVDCRDRGVYTCHLAAPVGEQNREGRVLLMLTDCPDILMTDTFMVIMASAVLMLALLIFIISYVSLRNLIRDRNKATQKETLLDARLRPLEKKDLMLIRTLGPKPSPTMKHMCV